MKFLLMWCGGFMIMTGVCPAAEMVTTPRPVLDLASVADKGPWRVQLSPYAYHFSHSPEHKPVYLLGIEREEPDQSVVGMVFFSNSFGQPSLFIYPWGGVTRDLLGVDGLYFKWSAGLMYGYKGKYQDKVPFNYKGLNPAIVPALGYQINKKLDVQVDALGAAGVMLQASYRVF